MAKHPRTDSKDERAPVSRILPGHAAASANQPEIITELREALRAREDFLAIAVHEIRNPITPIQLCVEILRRAVRAGDYGRVEREAERLHRLIEHFLKRTSVALDVARLTSGKLRLQPAEFDLSELVRDVIDGLGPVLARSGCEMQAEIQEKVTCVLDQMAVNQILENLITNAIKYGEGKPIEISLSANGAYGEIAVRDHGIGISQEEQERIFERFERAVGRTGQPGFGIGLWVSRQLAESMGGSITVAGAKGAGSLFTVKLPLTGK